MKTLRRLASRGSFRWLAVRSGSLRLVMAFSALLVLLCLLGPLTGPLGAQGRSQKYELPAQERTGTIRKVFVICSNHLDIGFTKPPDQVARDYKTQIDTALRLARENPDFRWTIESSWMLEEWLRRTDDEGLVNELGKLLREGRFGLGMIIANMHSGLMAPEESNRLVYLGEQFRRRFGIEGSVAYQDDVPGFTWAYPRILAGSRVKYLIEGLNLGYGGGNSLGMGKDPFWWVGPDGSRVLTWFTYSSYVEGYYWKLTSLQNAEQAIPRRLAWLEHNGYPYDAYFLHASVGDNEDPQKAYGVLLGIREWNRKHPELQIQMAIAEDFFNYLIQKYGDHFAEASGDSSGHWEMVKLGSPEVTAKMREDSNALPAGETLASIVSLLKGVLFPRYDFQQAWRELLVFHEHTAGAGPGWPNYFSRWETDWANVAHYAAAMSGYSNTVQQFSKALKNLAASGQEPGTAHETTNLVVYNGLSWKRSGPVIVGGLPREFREGPLEVVDALTGDRQPCEDVPGTHRQIIFWARDVPSVGYRLYKVEKVERPSAPAAGEPRFHLTWSEKGWITSIRDQKTGRELLAKESDRLFGGLYLISNSASSRLVSDSPAEVHVTDGPVSRRIEFVRQSSALPLTVVTLYPEAPYVDLRFDVDLNAGVKNERRQSYTLALTQLSGAQQIFVDGAGFVLRWPQDILPGGGAPHLMPVHFTHLQRTATWGATLANREAFALRPDLFFDLVGESDLAITREEGQQHLFRTEPRGSPVQSFHFRMAAQEEVPWEWERLGCELNLPLQALCTSEAPSPGSQSFFDLSQPGVQLLDFKPAEFRPGWYVLRLQEVSGKETQGVKLSTPFHFHDALQTDIVEHASGGPIDLSDFSLKPWETLTVLVRPE